MATASDKYRLYAQERRRGMLENDNEEQPASPPFDAGIGGSRLTLARSSNCREMEPGGIPVRMSLVHKIWLLAAIAFGFALTGAWTVLLVFALLRAVDVPV
jgi:hypothetical protein